MAQAGFTPISLYFSTTAAATPSSANLVAGELALNTVDEKLYFKNSAGTVKLLASNATSAPVLSFSAGTTGLTPNTATTGAVTLAGTLAVANGGTGLTAGTSGGILGYTASGTLASSSLLTANALVLGGGAGATPTPMASLGTTTTVLHGNVSGAPTFGAVSLTADITGTLPTANGGTGLGGATPFTANGVVYASSASALTTGSVLTFDGNKVLTNALGFNYYTGSYTVDGTISNYSAGNSLYVNGNAGGYLVLQGAGNQKQQIGISGSNSGGEIFFTSNGTETMRLTSTGLKASIAGTNADPVFSYTADTNTGIFFPAADKLGFTAGGGTDQMVLTSTGLGIGTSSPVEKLQSSKGIAATGANQSVGSLDGFVADFSSGASRLFASRNGVATSTLEFWTTDSGGAANKRMLLDSSGNVGIGTSSPASKLDINRGSAGLIANFTDGVNANFQIGTSAYLATIGPSAVTTAMAFKASDTEAMRISTDGTFRVKGAGTAGSTDAFQVAGGAPADAARIDSSGNLLVHGTQSTANTFMQININGGNSASGFMAVMANGSNIANQTAGIYLARTNNSIISAVDGNGAFRDNIIVTAGGSGGVVLASGATAWASNSDISKKIIIEPISNALNGMLSWRTIIGRYKTDDEQRRRLFLIAQDVQATNPEAVVVQDVGQESESLLLGYTDTIPVLVAAIQELKAIVDAQAARITVLEAA